MEVKDVQSMDGVIVHIMDGTANFKKGSIVQCKVDRERRSRLMAHHTATHLVSAAARSILGKHAWQEGAHKGPDKAHIDVSHYEKLTEQQIQEIEDMANRYITHGIKVTIKDMTRKEAESAYGFSIYQGHGVPGGTLRIVEVRDLDGNLIDAEACGGLHLAGMESTVGLIKIINSSRIHDGINRIEFVAGPASQDYINQIGASIDAISKLAGIDKDKLKTGLAAKLEELALYKDRYEKSEAALIEYIVKELAAIQGSEITKEMTYDRSMLRRIATAFATVEKAKVIMLSNKDGHVVVVAGSQSKKSALEFVKMNAKITNMDFRGGGSRTMAEGKLVKL
jgi:alanyl-tRNA synthetase